MSSDKRACKSASSWQSSAYERHRFRVKQATPAIDVNPPQKRTHVFYNAKGVQLERERQAQIVKDNFILLRKLHDIMHRKRKETEDQRLKWQETCCIKTR